MIPASGRPEPTAPSTVRVTPVDRWTSIPISTRRATTFSICSSVARSCITTTIAPAASTIRVMLLRPRILTVHEAALEPPRLVDDPFEEPRDRVRSERPFIRDAAHVRERLFLALRLIDLDAEVFFQLAD